jgi:serine/threonine-protein kinase
LQLLDLKCTDLSAAVFLEQNSEVFAVFGAATQDSGNVSYGVRAAGGRFFVKTAGDPNDAKPLLDHGDRVALLRNAVRLAQSVIDPALPPLRNVVESAEGPLLVYDWVEGELVGTPRARREDPASSFVRFRALSAAELATALDVVFRLHVNLARHGWIASDFYDGSLIYDFAARRIHVMDLDSYRQGPFANDMGRMFGSTRFMAPEEHERGARIDERTTVFTMGRTIEQLFASAPDEVIAVRMRACEPDPENRFQTVALFYEGWSVACGKNAATAREVRQ